MGKRELLLIVGFVVVGALVYQFTAPPPAAGERGFSLSRLIEGARREIRGNRASAQVTQTFTHPAARALQEVRVGTVRGEMTIAGEDRDDILAELRVTSRAYDDAEAQETAKSTKLKFDDAGGTVTISIVYPSGGRQTAALHLRVPQRLNVRLDDKNGTFVASNVAALEMGSSRGKTEVSAVAGRVTVTQRGGAITLRDIGSLRLNVRGGAEATVSDVRGDATFNLQSGELRASSLRGAIEIESTSADLKLEKLQETTGAIRINATSGTVELAGIRTDTRVDGRNSEIRIEVDQPAPIAVYNDGDERVEFVAPATAGFTLDALTRGSRITSEGDLLARWGLSVKGAESAVEQRVNGPVRGGGPTIILRSNNGDISLRQRERSGS
jgi:hypothetical protein